MLRTDGTCICGSINFSYLYVPGDIVYGDEGFVFIDEDILAYCLECGKHYSLIEEEQ